MEGDEKPAATMELGKNMRLTKEQGSLVLPKSGEIKIRALVQDNFQLDESSLKYGLGEWTTDQPVLIGEANPTQLQPEKTALTLEPVIFVKANVRARNQSILAIPVTFK